MDEALAVAARKRVPAEDASVHTKRLRAWTGACWVDSEAFSIQEKICPSARSDHPARFHTWSPT